MCVQGSGARVPCGMGHWTDRPGVQGCTGGAREQCGGLPVGTGGQKEGGGMRERQKRGETVRKWRGKGAVNEEGKA